MKFPGFKQLKELADVPRPVFRAVSEDSGERVLLIDHGSDRSRAEREFGVLSGLDVEGIPSPISLLNHDGRHVVVTADPGGESLRDLTALADSGLRTILEISERTASLLSDLHRADVLVGALAPDSVIAIPSPARVCLTDLGTAVPGVLRQEDILSFEHILPYAAPEMTGRLNREPDHRSDLYSLGALLYELFTGSPPFTESDPLELLHRHAAAVPEAPSSRRAEIPEMVSLIILKLLEKEPEKRYQSAAGLRYDLRRCLEALDAGKSIENFVPGAFDVPDRLTIPKTLYGRKEELDHLAALFERVTDGPPALVLVAGYSGIGKTSLIEEFSLTVRTRGGYFVSGKFDQVARGIPFGAMIEAVRILIGDLLTLSEEELVDLKGRIASALGNNGGVLTEVIPELELLIGKQPPAPALGAIETLNRLEMVFRSFLGAVASPKRPLAILLDDLQWADAATLGLLLPLAKGSGELRHFMLIGAYRDNEVDPMHPLSRAMMELESAGVDVHRLSLGPLDRKDLESFVRDTLRSDEVAAAKLAGLIQQKTAGNPFFVIQFLKTLKEEELIRFNYDKRRWVYDIGEIVNAGMTDNVVDLMTRKITRLSTGTQRALKLGSCIGNRFSPEMLAVISGQASERVTDDLSEAMREGLLEERGDDGTGTTYHFIHDRVQQAAHELLSEDKRSMVHLTVGRLLASTYEEQKLEDELFDVVNHLNLGRGLITGEDELKDLAELNLRAGRKARASAAFDSAHRYFQSGVGALSDLESDETYDLSFALRLGAAESEYLCGELDEDGTVSRQLLDFARNSLDRAKVFNLKMVKFENQALYGEAIAAARECLGLFGMSFPETDDEKAARLDDEVREIGRLIAGRPISALVELPEMEDPELRMVLNILTDIWSPTYITGDAVLARLLSATIVRLSLTHGCTAESAYGYVTHAITVGPVLGDYEAALEWGRLALAVNERFNDAKRRAKIHQQFHAHVALWRLPYKVCVAHAREATRSGLEAGDLLYAAYGAMTETWTALPMAENLETFESEYLPNLDVISRLKVRSFADGHRLILNWARALSGNTESPHSLTSSDFDEREYVQTYEGNPFFTMFHAIAKLDLSYTFGDLSQAMKEFERAHDLSKHLEGTIWPVFFDMWGGLTLAAGASVFEGGDREKALSMAEGSSIRLALLATNCPENYLVWSLLLKAELARARGNDGEALSCFESAVSAGRGFERRRETALAYELFGKYWEARGGATLASACLDKAIDRYEAFGARAKAAQLREEYGKRFETHGIADLNAASVIKAAQAMAAEIDLNKLLEALLEIVIENAGAERAVLFLEQEEGPVAVGERTTGSSNILTESPIPLGEFASAPHSMINYVHRTQKNASVLEGNRGGRFRGDSYFNADSPVSALAVPLVARGELKGILYLENNKLSGAFTEDTVRICSILGAQAAVPLENARLYREMRLEAEQRRNTEETLRSIMQGTAAVTGDSFFNSLVHHLAEAFRAKYAFITEFDTGGSNRANMIAFWTDGVLAAPGSFDVTNTPCESVLRGETCFYPSGVKDLFPKDVYLTKVSAEGYWGIPLRAASGKVIGHVAVIDDGPMTESAQGLSLLNIFAARAGAELERMQAERELQKALSELERLKERLEDENVYLREEIRQSHNFEEIIGESPALLQTLKDVESVAPTDATVLVTGETGTGKELIARALHNHSLRKNRPLVKVNCAAISAGLVESELFGHTKGAFTGAVDKRSGRFELANGGTIFLDEVGELPAETQVKILRVLQEGEFEPVGSSKTIKVDVRVIGATNRDLEQEVADGRFRSDLFYRLNVFPIRVPSLKERIEDLPALLMFFLERYSKAFGKNVRTVPNGVLRMLSEYEWPGNIRELQNLVERAVVLAPPDADTLKPELIPMLAATASPEQRAAGAPMAQRTGNIPEANASMEDIERSHIVSVLESTGWVIAGDSGAAAVLQLHPNTLRSRMKKLGIKRPRAS